MLAGSFEPTSEVIIDTLRGISGALIGIAIIDWVASDAEPSKAHFGIVLGHIVGYLFATVFSILSLIHGYPVYGWILIVVNALLFIGFLTTGLSRTRAVPSSG